MKPSILSISRLSFSLATALAALLATPFASAAVYYWDSDGTTAGFGSTTGTWGTDAFWTETAAGGSPHSAVATTLAADTVNFGTATVNYGNATVGIAAGGVTATSIVFGVGQTTALTIGSTTGPAITLGGATRSIVVNSTGHTINAPITLSGNSTISFGRTTNAAGAFTLGGAIGGTGNLTFATPAGNASNGNVQTINLGAAGGWSGSTTISTVVTGTSNTVRNTSGAANVLPTTTVLSFASVDGLGAGRTTTYDLNGQDQTLAGLSFTGTLNARRFLNLNNTGAAATLTINNTADHSFGAATLSNTLPAPGSPITTHARILGAIALTKNGAGTLSLGGTLSGGATVNAHPYTGATNILGGTLRLFSGGAITASSGITINGSNCETSSTNHRTRRSLRYRHPDPGHPHRQRHGGHCQRRRRHRRHCLQQQRSRRGGAHRRRPHLRWRGHGQYLRRHAVPPPIVTTSLATNAAGYGDHQSHCGILGTRNLRFDQLRRRQHFWCWISPVRSRPGGGRHSTPEQAPR
jgi:hypothetical protein